MDGDMRLRFPGLMEETLPSGNLRYRVRVKGQKTRKITLPIGPEHPDFQEAYSAGRRGERYASSNIVDRVEAGTVGWLVRSYMTHLEQMVATGSASALTLKQRRGFADRLLQRQSSTGRSSGQPYKNLPMLIPEAELLALVDDMMATPGAAKNMMKFIKAMYAWAVPRKHCAYNPAAGINVAYKSKGGATPWTISDLEKFRARHPFGSMAHLTLTLFMFTACRISCAVTLGRSMEQTIHGEPWLAWQPIKAGSRPVEIPILPPLLKAIRAQTLIGPTYLLTGKGQPFASPEALRNAMQRWCKEAEIEGKSSHGIRKAAGHLMALMGATQYEIMSVHGHAQASTSQVYTEGVERRALAQQAAAKLGGMDW
mgnify:CR=1 FL=1